MLLGDAGATVIAGPTIEQLVDGLGSLHTVGIDMPIGLPESGRRRADQLARDLVGPRRSSVFYAPVRSAVTAATFRDANDESMRTVGHGLSQQAYALRSKILEVEQWRRIVDLDVREVHPEVSFAVLSGRHLPSTKKTWAGTAERRALLADAGIVLPDDAGAAGHLAAVDDVLDAAVVAWTARRVLLRQACSLPDPPEVGPDGSPIAIWA